MSATCLGLPHSRESSSTTAVDTSGVAVPIPDGATDPFFPARQVKVETAAAIYVGWGADNTPPAAAETNTVYQGVGHETYALPEPPDALIDHLYVYAVTGTAAVHVSFFG